VTSVSRNTSSAPRILSWPVKSVKKAPRTSRVPAAAGQGRNLTLNKQLQSNLDYIFVSSAETKRERDASACMRRHQAFTPALAETRRCQHGISSQHPTTASRTKGYPRRLWMDCRTSACCSETERERERDASACMGRQQGSAIALVCVAHWVNARR